MYVLGVVKSKRSLWRLRTITDFFWAIVNFIGVFFTTMFSVISEFACVLFLPSLNRILISRGAFYRWKRQMHTGRALVEVRNGMVAALEVLEVVHMVEALVGLHVD